jgi:hypothetical protein
MHSQQRKDSGFPAWLFFPEVISFGIAIVLSPVWAVDLTQQGYYRQAVGIALAGVLSGMSFVWFLRKGRRLLAWSVIAAFVFALWTVASSLPHSAMNLSR